MTLSTELDNYLCQGEEIFAYYWSQLPPHVADVDSHYQLAQLVECCSSVSGYDSGTRSIAMRRFISSSHSMSQRTIQVQEESNNLITRVMNYIRECKGTILR
jgi:hypothetical protein